MKTKLLLILMAFPYFAFSQLTGYWKTNTDGCYQITQKGKNVYWTAEEGSSKRAKNIFKGTLSGTKLKGVWCDMPSHNRNNCNEKITLKLEGENRMVKISSSIFYRGDVWNKLNGTCESGRKIDGNSNNLNRCFEKYANSKIQNHNKRTLKKSLEGCADECLSYDWCKSFDYRPKSQKCLLSTKNKNDNVRFKSDNGIAYYHNICWSGKSNSDNTSGSFYEEIFVSAFSSKKVSTSKSLKNGKKYTLELSGTYSFWSKKDPVGVDAMFMYKKSKTKLRKNLHINDIPLIEYMNTSPESIRYKKDHKYKVKITGTGKRLHFGIKDSGKYGGTNNSGGITIKIYNKN